MMRLNFFILLFILSCSRPINSAEVIDYREEAIKSALKVVEVDSLNWKINGYIVAQEANPFHESAYFFNDFLESQGEKFDFAALTIENIRNENPLPFKNNLTTNKKSAFYLFFSPIHKDYFTLEIFQWYKNRDLRSSSFYQGQSIICLFLYNGENEVPKLLDQGIVHYN